MLRRSALVVFSLLAAAFAALADDEPGLAPGDTPGETRVASALQPAAAAVPALLEEAMAPAPKVAELKTSYYGVIRLDHQAHLARKTACRACHGPGRVTKIELAPKVAHERCIGCHTQQSAGPTSCKGCHDTSPPPPPPELITAAAHTARPALPAPPPPPTVEQQALLDVSENGPGTTFAALRERKTLSRVLETGAAAGSGFGLSLRLASRSDGYEISHAIERIDGDDQARTLGLFGVGWVRPLQRRFTFVASGLVGFDAIDEPAVAWLPAVGARVSVEWAPPRSWWLQRFQLGVTGLADLGRTRVGPYELGGWAGYLTLSTGIGLTGDSP